MVARKPTARSTRPRLDADEVNANLERKFGRNIIIDGAELAGRTIERASTGSLAFDIMLGGGLPLNHWNEVIGQPSSGKTSMIYKTVATQQSLNPDHKTLWVASEHFASQWAETAGMELRGRVKVAETNIMEEAYETVIEYLDNRLVDCIVIDSLPALVPSDENDHDMGEWQQALGARLTNKFFRKQSPASKRSLVDDDRSCLLIIVNQWRDKVGVVFGDPRTTPGGKGKDYYYYTRFEMARDEWILADSESKRRVGIKMRAHTIKNKSAPVERTANVAFYFDHIEGQLPGHYDIGRDLFESGLFTDVIEKRGSTYEFGGQIWRKKETMQQSLREDLDLRALMRFEVLRAIGVDTPVPEPVHDDVVVPMRKKTMARK